MASVTLDQVILSYSSFAVADQISETRSAAAVFLAGKWQKTGRIQR